MKIYGTIPSVISKAVITSFDYGYFRISWYEIFICYWIDVRGKEPHKMNILETQKRGSMWRAIFHCENCSHEEFNYEFWGTKSTWYQSLKMKSWDYDGNNSDPDTHIFCDHWFVLIAMATLLPWESKQFRKPLGMKNRENRGVCSGPPAREDPLSWEGPWGPSPSKRSHLPNFVSIDFTFITYVCIEICIHSFLLSYCLIFHDIMHSNLI